MRSWLVIILSCLRSIPSKMVLIIVPHFLEKDPLHFSLFFLMTRVSVQQLYGVYKFPESFVILKDGTVVEKDHRPIRLVQYQNDYLSQGSN